MSLSHDEGERRPEAPPPPAPPAPPAPPHGGPPDANSIQPSRPERGAESGEARPDPSLAKDLREVASGSPERAFNLGVTLGIVVSAATAIFVLQNSGPTQFEWLWFDFRLPLWLALVGAIVAGVILTLTLFAIRRRHRTRIGRREKAAGRLRQALARSGRRPTTRASGGTMQT